MNPFPISRLGNRLAVLLGTLVLLTARAQDATFAETESEFAASADFNGDGLRDVVIVDRTSGWYRMIPGTNGNRPIFPPLRPTGIAPVDGFTAGPLLTRAPGSSTVSPTATNQPDFAVSGNAANRVLVFDGAAVAPQPRALFTIGVGPGPMVALDIAGATNTPMLDLVVLTAMNGPAVPNRWETLRNSANAFAPLGDVTDPHTRRHVTRIQPKAGGNVHRVVSVRTSGGIEALEFHAIRAGLPVSDASSGPLAAGSRFAAGVFGNRTLASVLTWVPGSSEFAVWPVSEPVADDFELPNSPAARFGFGTNTVDGIFVVEGPTRPQLVISLNDARDAWIFDFDGVNAPVPRDVVGSLPDEHFNFAFSTAPGRIATFSNLSRAPGPSDVQRVSVWNGTNYAQISSYSFGSTIPAHAYGNVSQFRGEPFVSPHPELLSIDRAGDWASVPTLTPSPLPGAPGVVTVSGESDRSSLRGLGSSNVVTLAAIPGTTAVLANQLNETLSITPLTGNLGPVGADLVLYPRPGTYPTAISMTLSSGNAADRIRYRLDGGEWVPYAGPVLVQVTTTVEAYAESSTGAGRSRILSGRYTLTTSWASQDSDGDGVPDFVESARGLDPRAGTDSDRDGFSDLDEILSGSNPADASSVPPAGHEAWTRSATVDLSVVPQPHLVPLPAFGSADGTVVGLRTLQGTLLSEAVTTNRLPLNTPGAAEFHVGLGAGGLVSLATPEHFLASPERPVAGAPSARELVGLFVVPNPAPAEIPFGSSGHPDAAAVRRWEDAARAFLSTNSGPSFDVVLQPVDLLVTALFERKLDEILTTNVWSRSLPLGLFPHRPSDAGRTNPPAELLANLTRPSTSNTWNLVQMLADLRSNASNLPDRDILDLRLLTTELYRVCTFSNSVVVTNALGTLRPVTHGPVLDELRRLVADGTVGSAYATLPSVAGLLPGAAAGARRLLDGVSPRNRVTLDLVMVPDPESDSCTVLRTPAGAAVALLDTHLNPYPLAIRFPLAPGARIRAVGYEDVPVPSCATRALEVVTLSVVEIPIPDEEDTDADGLPDAWERFFFTGDIYPYGYDDNDRDGYYNHQELEAGTDPSSAASHPAGPPQGSGLAVNGLRVEPNGEEEVSLDPSGGVIITGGGKARSGIHLMAGNAEGIHAKLGIPSDTDLSEEGVDGLQPLRLPNYLDLTVFGTVGSKTNQPVTALSAAGGFSQLTLTISTAAQGSRSNLILLAGKGGQPLGFGYVTNRGRILLTRQSGFLASQGPSGPLSKSKSGVVGVLVQKLSAVVGKARSVALAGLSQTKDAVTTVVQVAADAAAEGVWNGATGNGGDEEGDGEGEGGEGEDPMVAELPGGIVIPGVRTVTVLPADPTLNSVSVSQLDVITLDAGRFSVSDAGVIRNDILYGSAGPTRIAGLGTGEADGLGLSQYTGFKSSKASGFGTTGGITARRELVPERTLELFQSPGSLPTVTPFPDLDFDAVDPRHGGLEVHTAGTTGKGPLLHLLRLQPRADELVIDFAYAGIIADSVELGVSDELGSGCASTNPPASSHRLRGTGRLVGMRSEVPVLGQRTALLRTRLQFDAPMSWVGDDGRTRCSGTLLTVTTVLREPVLMLDEEPRVTVYQGQFGSVAAGLRPQRPFDRGDAPVSATGGLPEASHRIVSGLRLGRVADPERASLPDALALGDDVDGFDDDDGVLPQGAFLPGSPVTLDLMVVAPPSGARLDAFADWNRDRDWNDADEQIARSLLLTNGLNRLTLPIPAGASNGVVLARFRLSSAGGLAAFGTAPDGEVEDYRWLVGTPLRPARVSPILIDADGLATVQVDADPGSIVTLESTTSLDGGTWSSERPPVATGAGSTQLPADAATARHRFFRIRTE